MSTAEHFSVTLGELESMLVEGHRALLRRRENRPRPHLDDKVLTDWNSLMISAFAFAGSVFDSSEYYEAAENAAQFILSSMTGNDGRLWHRYRDKEAAVLGNLQDYAFFLGALLDLFEYRQNVDYLKSAKRIADEIIRLFCDFERGGMYLTGVDAERLIYRPKEVYDGAVPSGNSAVAYHFLRLYHITTDERYAQMAEGIFRFFFDDVSLQPGAHCQMMMAVQFANFPVKEIVVTGEKNDFQKHAMLKLIRKSWLAQRVIISGDFSSDDESLIPLLLGKPSDLVKVYLCENRTCLPPCSTVEELKEALQG